LETNLVTSVPALTVFLYWILVLF